MITRYRRRRKGRASVMLEFALIFPVALAIMLFAVDMGRLVLLNTGLHDATAVAARAGARQGFVGTDTSGPSYTAFQEAVDVLPGLSDSVSSFSIVNPTTNFSGSDRSGRWCTQTDLYVRVRAQADIQFITPGLGSILTAVGGGSSNLPGGVTITSTGVARCEVAR